MARWRWLVLICAIALVGCSKKEQPGKKAGPVGKPATVSLQAGPAVDTSQKAIMYSQKLKTKLEKKEYLTMQAQEFYNAQKYRQVAEVARHILQKVDKNSSTARLFLVQAQRKLDELDSAAKKK